MTLTPGQTGTALITVMPENNSSLTAPMFVTLSCSGLPNETSCTFTPESVQILATTPASCTSGSALTSTPWPVGSNRLHRRSCSEDSPGRNPLRRFGAPSDQQRTGRALHRPSPRAGQRFSRFCPAQCCSRPSTRKSASILLLSEPRFAPTSKRPSCARFSKRWIARRFRHRSKLARETLSWANASAPNESAASGCCGCRRARVSGRNCVKRTFPAGSRRSQLRMRFNTRFGFSHGTLLARMF